MFGPGNAPPNPARAITLLLALALGFALGACGPVQQRSAAARSSEQAPANNELPGPAPRGRSVEVALALNGACEGCHAQIAAEWRESLHARSHTDAVYQRAFALEPLQFCQACHAPEADPALPVPEAAAKLGVGCVTCHVVAGELLAAPPRSAARGPGSAAKAAPHPVLGDARLGGSAACAGCHEFEFPDRTARKLPELMQSTVSEHARSADRDRACASCHMPAVEPGGVPHRSHAFLGGHDTGLVKSAVVVKAEREGEVARITITPRELGHAFPTGDLFRRLEVSAEAVGSERQVVASQRRYLMRHWQRLPGPFGVVLRHATEDDRPLDAELVVELALGTKALNLPIAWRVAYQRVEHPRSDSEQDSSVEGEIEIAAGTLETQSETKP
jgi:hypothetical protein